ADAELLAELAQQLVGWILVRVLDHPEHPLGLCVVRSQLRLPVAHLGPLAVLEERLRGDVERGRVAKAAASHAAAGHDGYVLEGGETEDPLHAQPRAPEVA